METAYQFRERIDIVHSKSFRDPDAVSRQDEIVIDSSWQISLPANAPAVMKETARDLQDYFQEAMGTMVSAGNGAARQIVLKTDETLETDTTFYLDISADKIIIAGRTPRAVRFGGIQLENLCNMREAPFLLPGRTVYKRLISPRIVHSGWGIDIFPDSHLNAISHAGFDAIAVFVNGINSTRDGFLDINDLTARADRYGLDTYFYSYLPAYKHPDDPDAEEFFENVYTRLFEAHPKVKGVMLVGESAVFPSRDPATSGRRFGSDIGPDQIPDPRPCPGWYPCEDYPRWIAQVQKAVHKAKPDAEIIFNTYNWGWVDLELREKFLAALPEKVMIQVTFDIFADVKFEDISCVAMDYTICVDKPGYYFTSECRSAKKYDIPLMATANTAGMTWDVGDVPYIPVPQQWMRRFAELDRTRIECGLSAFYDNHHYGWFPSAITELAKWYFQSPQCDPDELLRRMAVRYAGENGAGKLLEAWDLWSQAINHFPVSNEDQYGPLRVGASYPFIFHPNLTRTMAGREIMFPTSPKARIGNKIIKTMYQPYENINQLPGAVRFPVEIRELNRFLELWDAGTVLYEAAIASAPERKKPELLRELGIGKFIRSAAVTCRNIKLWYQLNIRLLAQSDVPKALDILNEIEALVHAEEANVTATIPLVEADSRLGWEPTMEYVCDREHLEWKLRQLKVTLKEINDYRTILGL